MNKNIQVSLFKREGNLTAIIPLCLYELCGFYIKESKEFILPQDIKLIKINYKDLSYYNDFIKLNHSKFKIFISTSLANISELIKTENIYIYALIQKDTILSLYFFKKQCTYLEEENEEIVTCYASINCCKSEDIFKVGFQNALMNIIDNYPSYKLLIIENHSDNDRLIDFYSKINKLLFNIKSAYYFYNFAHHSYHSNHTLILL